jgi:prepilin-type N-terminal cleavage/methylation domain-containing protein
MHSYKKAFTLVELLVAIGIFVAMTAILVVKYSGFSEGMTLTNLAYDIALTIREAQSYGINVVNPNNVSNSTSDEYTSMYGVRFNTGVRNQFILYGDFNNNGKFDAGTETIRTYSMKNGNTIELVCVTTNSTSCGTSAQVLEIQFKRPDPTPVIKYGTIVSTLSRAEHGEIRLKSPRGSYRRVIVRSSGQISIEESPITQTQ